MVDLIGSYGPQEPVEVGGIAQVPEVKEQASALAMGVLVDMVDAASIETARTTDQAVHFVPFFQQQFSQIGSVLSRDSRNERFFGGSHVPPSKICKDSFRASVCAWPNRQNVDPVRSEAFHFQTSRTVLSGQAR